MLFTTLEVVALSGFGDVPPLARRALGERRGWLTEPGF
jgi:hypothetical protein